MKHALRLLICIPLLPTVTGCIDCSHGWVDATSYSSLNELVDEVGGKNVSVLISHAIPLSGDLTVPDTISLHFIRTGSIELAGFSLTVRGDIAAGWFPILIGDGQVRIEGSRIKVDWFDSPHKAFAAIAGDHALIEFAPRAYTLTEPLKIDSQYMSVKGNRAQLTSDNKNIDLVLVNGSAPTDGSGCLRQISIEELYLSAPRGSRQAGMKVRDVSGLMIRDCKFRGFKYGIDIAIRDRNAILNNEFYNCEIGIYHPTWHTDNIPQTSYFEGNAFSVGSKGRRAFSLETPFESFTIRNSCIAGEYEYGIYTITGTAEEKEHSSMVLNIEDVSFEQGLRDQCKIFIEARDGKRLTLVRITGCSIGNSLSHGIRVRNTTNLIISGNRFFQRVGIPIDLDHSCDYVTVSDNYFATKGPEYNGATNLVEQQNSRE